MTDDLPPHASVTDTRARAAEVRAMFARIVPRYDLINRLMTAGNDVRWRRHAAQRAEPSGARALDLATGTGDLALELLKQGARRVIGVDSCEPMIEAARAKLGRHRASAIDLIGADALGLPFPSATFDCVTSAFLLRNVVDLPSCLAEMRRVTRPGGRVVALDLTSMQPGLPARVLRLYFDHVVAQLGRCLAGDEIAYRYLPASVSLHPDADHLARMFQTAGFERVTYRRLGLGSVAIHVARVPDADTEQSQDV
ncbi:MAG: ubiquinone/menaquinone biosynthesis methyltransferase [Chloroflexi bacterium]|nr:ubiquinone/menaquinone biosynthesis methyltransferase [Chloroflexota bacterium]